MKKIKLITSLCSLGAIVVSTPIVATSCSSASKEQIELNKKEVPINDSEEITVKLTSEDGPVVAKEIKVTSSNESILKVNKSFVSAYGSAFIDVAGQKKGDVNLSVSVIDNEGNSVSSTFPITVTDPDIKVWLNSAETDYIWSDENKMLYWQSIPPSADVDAELSFKGSIAVTRYKIFDAKGDDVDSTIASVGLNGALTIKKTAFTDPNKPLYWEIQADGAQTLPFTMVYKNGASVTTADPKAVLPATVPTDAVVLGTVDLFQNGKPVQGSATLAAQLAVTDVAGSTGLTAASFAIEWNAETKAIEVKTAAAYAGTFVAGKDDGELTITWTENSVAVKAIDTIKFGTEAA